jgi:hypothetical protein
LQLMIVGGAVSEHPTPMYGCAHSEYMAEMHGWFAHAAVAPHAAGIGMHTVLPSDAPPKYVTSTWLLEQFLLPLSPQAEAESSATSATVFIIMRKTILARPSPCTRICTSAAAVTRYVGQ